MSRGIKTLYVSNFIGGTHHSFTPTVEQNISQSRRINSLKYTTPVTFFYWKTFIFLPDPELQAHGGRESLCETKPAQKFNLLSFFLRPLTETGEETGARAMKSFLFLCESGFITATACVVCPMPRLLRRPECFIHPQASTLPHLNPCSTLGNTRPLLATTYRRHRQRLPACGGREREAKTSLNTNKAQLPRQ